MYGRGIFRLFAALLAVAIAVGIGAAVYNAGITAGLNEAAQSAVSGTPVTVAPYAYGPYWHGPWGFGFFGIFFGIFGLFLVLGLIRAAFGWGRWGGRDHGGSWGTRAGGRHEMVEAWHRELHRRESDGGERAGSEPA